MDDKRRRVKQSKENPSMPHLLPPNQAQNKTRSNNPPQFPSLKMKKEKGRDCKGGPRNGKVKLAGVDGSETKPQPRPNRSQSQEQKKCQKQQSNTHGPGCNQLETEQKGSETDGP